MYVLDFETKKIGVGQDLFPKPVGFAWLNTNTKNRGYLAWGHPSGNTCTEDEAKQLWQDVTKDNEVMFHNAKFDLGVAKRHWGVEPPPWYKVHDTMFLAFIADNLAASYALKPMAEKYLHLPPEERDELLELAKQLGLLAHNAKNVGPVISELPAEPVGRYAIGDVVRTWELYKVLREQCADEPYNRERQLLPILLRRELDGIKCDVRKLSEETKAYTLLRSRTEAEISNIIGSDSVNLDSGPDLAKVLIDKGLFDVDKAPRTRTGKVSTAKATLAQAVTSPRLIELLNTRSTLNTYIDTFMTPWLLEAEANGGRVYPSFNQVRQTGQDAKNKGTKTGRLSAPRFLNVPKSAEEGLPNVRSYLLPFENHTWIKRDYSAQEYRVLGHYIGGAFAQIFIDNPQADVHQRIADMMGVTRRHAKTIGFGIIYGLGIPGLAGMLGMNQSEAQNYFNEYMKLVPEVKVLKRELSRRYNDQLPITTWGGRQIKADPPGYNKKFGRFMAYDYKLLNYLVQGGSADVTKQSIVNYDDALRSEGLVDEVLFLVAVHDELNSSAPKQLADKAMQIKRDAMAAIRLDCPLVSDGDIGASWGELNGYKD